MIEQGSAAWFRARTGKATASRVGDVIAKLKSGKPAATRQAYLEQLVAERITGDVEEHFVSKWMKSGIENEPLARAAYVFRHDVDVQEAGIFEHPSIDMSAASPDGLVGDDGLLEIKCLGTRTHIETILSDEIDPMYLAQMQWQMACTGRSWCDFASFDPRMPEHMKLYEQRVPRDDALIVAMEAEVREFLAEVSDTVAAVRAKFASPTPWGRGSR